MPKHLLVFGSSLNPVTKAHIAIVRYYREKLEEIYGDDFEIHVNPVYKHIYAGTDKDNLASFDARLVMAQAAFAGIKNVKVTDIERRVYHKINSDEQASKVSVGTIDILKSYDQDQELSLILGRDTIVDLLGGKWKDAHDIIARCKHFYVLPRDEAQLPEFMYGVDPLADISSSNDKLKEEARIKKLNEQIWPAIKAKIAANNRFYQPLIGNQISLMNIPPNVSSSNARKALKSGDIETMNACLSEDVLQIISECRLYEKAQTKRLRML